MSLIRKGDTVVTRGGAMRGVPAKVKLVHRNLDRAELEMNLTRDQRRQLELDTDDPIPGIEHRKAKRADPNTGFRGGWTVIPKKIHLSNLQLIDAKTGEKVKVTMKVVDGKRRRVNKQTGEVF